MQHFIHRVAGAYRVTFSPEVWQLIGSMPSVAFQGLQLALECIADSPRRGATEAQSGLSTTLGRLTIVYALDEAERTLTVMNVLKAGSQGIP